jgi:hypothetical protein
LKSIDPGLEASREQRELGKMAVGFITFADTAST